MKKILFIAVLFFTTMGFSQSGKLEKADKLYDKLAYASAAELYEELLKSEVDSPAMQSKLAYCYLQMGKIAESEKIYAEVIQTGANPTLDYYYYAQVLKQNGKYQESDKWMKKYHEIAKNDSRGIEFIENENYIQKIEKSGNKFIVKTLAINTENADFGGYGSGKKAYFITNRADNPHVKNTWTWNNERFLDLYSADVLDDKELVNPKIHTKRVNTRFHEGPLCFSPDGKKVFFTRNNIAGGKERKDEKGIQNLKLYIADVIQEGIWLNEREFEYNSREYSVGHPSISADGKSLYFVSDMPGGLGGADIYRVDILENNAFGKPENLGPAVNTEGQDMFPWVNSENLLFFSSDGHVGLGGLDVFVAIPSSQHKYGKILNVGKPVNSNRDDFAFIMDAASLSGYFSSNRDGGKGGDDIYAYRLEKPFKASPAVKGKVFDRESKQVLVNSLVVLKDEGGSPIDSVYTDANGEYAFDLEDGRTYTIEPSAKDYFPQTAQLTAKQDNPEQTLDLGLEKDPGLMLSVLVTDKESGKPLEGVHVKITDRKNNREFADGTTTAPGDLTKALKDKKVGDSLTYTILLEKEGYISKTTTVSLVVEAAGIIRINQYADLSIGVAKVGTDLASLIDIKPIYFDLGKYFIRADAATELDKIVKVMNEYPAMVVELGSHTDCRSSKAFNLKLSDKRAKASAAYIKARITNPERIYGKGYGESRLKNGCACEGAVKSTCSEAEHQENRRTEFIIKKMK